SISRTTRQSNRMDKASTHPYAVEAILSSRLRQKRSGAEQREFLVKWADRELGQTWESRSSLAD
ncbi:hypothetical protein CSUI_006578, partial [Cystoisospora suis]